MLYFQSNEKETDKTQRKESKNPVYYVPGCLNPDLNEHDITDGTFYIDFEEFLPGMQLYVTVLLKQIIYAVRFLFCR